MSNKDIISCWGVWETTLTVEEEKSKINPFDVEFKGIFKQDNRELAAFGFYDGNGTYKLRFMPDKQGMWTYQTVSEMAVRYTMI